jgi:hypothetical protein
MAGRSPGLTEVGSGEALDRTCSMAGRSPGLTEVGHDVYGERGHR